MTDNRDNSYTLLVKSLSLSLQMKAVFVYGLFFLVVIFLDIFMGRNSSGRRHRQ